MMIMMKTVIIITVLIPAIGLADSITTTPTGVSRPLIYLPADSPDDEPDEVITQRAIDIDDPPKARLLLPPTQTDNFVLDVIMLKSLLHRATSIGAGIVHVFSQVPRGMTHAQTVLGDVRGLVTHALYVERCADTFWETNGRQLRLPAKAYHCLNYSYVFLMKVYSDWSKYFKIKAIKLDRMLAQENMAYLIGPFRSRMEKHIKQAGIAPASQPTTKK